MSGKALGTLMTVVVIVVVLIAGVVVGRSSGGSSKTVVVTAAPDVGATVTAAVAQVQARPSGNQPAQATPVAQILTQPVTQAPVVQAAAATNTPQPPPTTAPAVQQASSSNYSSVCNATKGNRPFSDQTGGGNTAHWQFKVPTGATAFVWGGSFNGQPDGYKVFMEGASVDATVKDGGYCLVDKNNAEQAWNQLLAETAGNPHSTKPDCPSGWKCRGV